MGGRGLSFQNGCRYGGDIGKINKLLLLFTLYSKQTTVLYYAKEGYYRHMQSALSDLLTRFGSEPILLFWKAFSMILEGI